MAVLDSLLQGASMAERAPYPGTSLGCWMGDLTYQACCLDEGPPCWPPGSAFPSAELCCSSLYEALVSSTWAPTIPMVSVMPDADRGLAECLEDAGRGTAWEYALDASWGSRDQPGVLQRNNFIQAAECVAGLPGVAVALDLFLGGGGTAAAMAWALGHKRAASTGSGASRPAELFSFERSTAKVLEAIGRQGALGAGWRSGWWTVRRQNATTSQDYQRLQADLRGAPTGDRLQHWRPVVWVLEGQPHPSLEGYVSRNPLDLLCALRAPIDVAVLDPSHSSIELEWMTIELACRPRWVLVVNVNLAGAAGASFVKGRLDMLAASMGSWRMEAFGHFVLHHEPWLSVAEFRRVRAWAVYSRRAL